MNIKGYSLCLLLALFSTQLFAASKAKQVDFKVALNYIESKINSLEDNPEAFAKKLDDIHKKAWQFETSFVDVEKLKPEAGPLIHRIFLQRLRLRSIVQKLDKEDRITPELVSSLRKIFRAARTVEDMLYELAIGFKQKQFLDPSITSFSNPPKKMGLGWSIDLNQYNPVYGNKFNIKSGDVFIIKGNAFMSAAIARIGDVDSQFSHAGLAYVDPISKEVFIVEAQVANGVRIIPIKKFLNQKVGRMMQFRYVPKGNGDEVLAEKAGYFAYEHTRLSILNETPVIYGFDMTVDDYDTQFCSKVIRWAFDRASRGEVKVPTDIYLSILDLESNAFIKSIGVTVNKTFAPADLELTPEFDLVTEWRDPRMTPDLRIKDQVLTSMMYWLEEEHLEFQLTPYISSLANIANYRVSKKITEVFIGPIPVAVPDHILETVIMLERTGSELHKYTKKRAQSYLKEGGTPMTPKHLELVIEQAREDLEKNGQIGYLSKY